MSPLEIPPTDHGSDRFDYVEVINAPPGVAPAGRWVDRIVDEPCLDCRANVFIRYAEPDPLWPESEGWTDKDGHTWYVAVAHDETCPSGPTPRLCESGCGCRYGTTDPDARDCACGGPCQLSTEWGCDPTLGGCGNDCPTCPGGDRR